MTSRAVPPARDGGDARRLGRRSAVRSVMGTWFRPSFALLWRVPLFLVLVVMGLWFAFRGLVHLAFIFDAHPIGTFIFAPALLPFAALPALSFLFSIRTLAWSWNSDDLSPGQRSLVTGGAPVAALLVAEVVDLIQINLIRLMGVHLPRLPLDPY